MVWGPSQCRVSKDEKKMCRLTHGTRRATQGSLDDRKPAVSTHVKRQVKLIYEGQSPPFQIRCCVKTGIALLAY